MTWSLILAAGGIFGIWLAGRQHPAGWPLGFAMQFLWAAYALATAQYGFLLTAAGYGWVYWTNMRRAHTERKAQAQADQDEFLAAVERLKARYRAGQ